MANVSVKRVSKDKLNSEIEDKTVEGWVLQNRNDKLGHYEESWGMG